MNKITNIKTARISNLFLLLGFSLMLACSKSNPESANVQTGDAASSGPEFSGTKALQVKTGDEYYATLQVLTGVDTPNNNTQRAYTGNAAGFPQTSDPTNFNYSHFKQIVSLAGAFCNNDVIANDARRRALFPKGSIFDSDDIPNSNQINNPIVIEMIVNAFSRAYWVGSIALARSGEDLPYGLTSRQELRTLANELIQDGANTTSILRAVCTATLSSGSVIFH